VDKGGKALAPLARWLLEKLDDRNESARAASLGAGLDHAAISRFLQGVAPTPDSCRKLADYFEVPAEFVLALAGHMPTPEEHDAFVQQVAELAKDWSEEERRLGLELLRTVRRVGRRE